jgi:hypothetical protein
MVVLKRLLIVLLTPFLVLLLFAAAVDYGIIKTAGHPAQVKKLVADSGLYSSIIPNMLAQQKNIDTSIGKIPLSDPDVKQAAVSSFSPSLVQKNTEDAIDNIYSWLNGQTPTPSFSFDFSAAQAKLAVNLGAAAQAKAASLPACTTPYTASSFDVYNATCLPKGVTPVAVGQTVAAQVASGKGFIDKPVLAAGDIKNNSGQSVFTTQLKDFPKQYQRVKKSPYVLILLAALVAVALIFLHSPLASGLRHVGIVFVGVGIFMLIFAWGVGRANTTYIQPKIKLSNSAVSVDVKKLSTDIIQNVDKNYYAFGAVYSLIGVGMLAAPLSRHRKDSDSTPDDRKDTPKSTTPAAAKESQPVKRVIKVQ